MEAAETSWRWESEQVEAAPVGGTLQRCCECFVIALGP